MAAEALTDIVPGQFYVLDGAKYTIVYSTSGGYWVVSRQKDREPDSYMIIHELDIKSDYRAAREKGKNDSSWWDIEDKIHRSLAYDLNYEREIEKSKESQSRINALRLKTFFYYYNIAKKTHPSGEWIKTHIHWNHQPKFSKYDPADVGLVNFLGPNDALGNLGKSARAQALVLGHIHPEYTYSVLDLFESVKSILRYIPIQYWTTFALSYSGDLPNIIYFSLNLDSIRHRGDRAVLPLLLAVLQQYDYSMKAFYESGSPIVQFWKRAEILENYEEREFLAKWLKYVPLEFVFDPAIYELMAQQGSKPYELGQASPEVFRQLKVYEKYIRQFKRLPSNLFADKRSRRAEIDSQAYARAKDRQAQHNPAYTIAAHPQPYEMGKKLAPLIQEVLLYIAEQAKKRPVVIHGRDGELLHKLLQRMGIHVAYVVTPRTLTTEGGGDQKYHEYLRRLIPKNALHIDTGFAGSVPKWCGGKGLGSKDFALIFANDEKYQIPISTETIRACKNPNNLMSDRHALRAIVADDIEHSSHRLEKPSSWRKVKYSKKSDEFWALLYGAADSLGLSRTLRVGPGGRTLGGFTDPEES